MFWVEKSLQFWASIFGNTMCLSFLEFSVIKDATPQIIDDRPEHAVVGVPDDIESEHGVGGVEVEHEVERLLGGGREAEDEVLDGLHGGLQELRGAVPHTVQVRAEQRTLEIISTIYHPDRYI